MGITIVKALATTVICHLEGQRTVTGQNTYRDLSCPIPDSVYKITPILEMPVDFFKIIPPCDDQCRKAPYDVQSTA